MPQLRHAPARWQAYAYGQPRTRVNSEAELLCPPKGPRLVMAGQRDERELPVLGRDRPGLEVGDGQVRRVAVGCMRRDDAFGRLVER